MKSLFKNRKVFLIAFIAMCTSACTMGSCRLATILFYGYDPGYWVDIWGYNVWIGEGGSATGLSFYTGPFGSAFPLQFLSGQPAVSIRSFYSDRYRLSNGIYVETDSAVSFFDGRNPALKSTIPVRGGLQTFQVAPDGRWLYTTSRTSTALYAVDLLNKAVGYQVDFGPGTRPTGIAITPDSSRVFVTDPAKNSIYSVDPNSQTFRTILDPGIQPGLPGITPDGQNLFVPNFASNDVFVLDIMTETPVTTMTGVPSPTEVSFNPMGTLGFVINSPSGANGSLWTFDPGSFMSLGTTPLGSRPQSIAWSPGGTFMHIATAGDGFIRTVDSTAKPPKLVANTRVGINPVGVATVRLKF